MYEQLTLFDFENRDTEKYVRRVSYADVKPFLLNVHYARRMPCITDAFGLFLNGEMVGCVTYGVPASPPLCRGIAGDENVGHVLELNRLVISPEIPGGGGSKKNLASYLVSHSLKMLPNGTFVVSYADTGWTHVGYVYQACNFLYTGCTKKRIDRYVQEGKHCRHYDKSCSLHQTRNPKHRYVYLVGDRRTRKRMREELRYPVYDHYPKGDERRYDEADPQIAEPIRILPREK